MKVRYLDLRVNDQLHERESLTAMDKVLSHGVLILGPEVKEFEERVAESCCQKYAVGVGSGTDALLPSPR